MTLDLYDLPAVVPFDFVAAQTVRFVTLKDANASNTAIKSSHQRECRRCARACACMPLRSVCMMRAHMRARVRVSSPDLIKTFKLTIDGTGKLLGKFAAGTPPSAADIINLAIGSQRAGQD